MDLEHNPREALLPEGNPEATAKSNPTRKHNRFEWVTRPFFDLGFWGCVDMFNSILFGLLVLFGLLTFLLWMIIQVVTFTLHLFCGAGNDLCESFLNFHWFGESAPYYWCIVLTYFAWYADILIHTVGTRLYSVSFFYLEDYKILFGLFQTWMFVRAAMLTFHHQCDASGDFRAAFDRQYAEHYKI